MKTLLALAPHPETGETIRSALNPEHYRLIHRLNVGEAEPLLRGGLVAACILDVESAQIQGLWSIEKIRALSPRCPIIVFAGSLPWDWEEDAYVQGVSHILSKPVRPRILNELLDRFWTGQLRESSQPTSSPLPVVPKVGSAPSPDSFRTLEALRDFSEVLSHSLQAEGLLRKFLILLREILGVNRAAIFLRNQDDLFGAESIRCMRSACAIGLQTGLLEHFELSFETGIGGYLFRQGRILRRDSPEAQGDLEMQKEFELLGTQVAIPILDREVLVGVAAFDGRVTGEPLLNGELELIFHLLEQLGLAIKNIWLHAQLSANHEMLANVLRQLTSACVVVNRDLVVLHANKAARRLFLKGNRKSDDFEFSDLPQLLGSKVYQVLQTGNALATFKFEPPDPPAAFYQVSIVPFQRQAEALPGAALMLVEDQTQSQQLKKLEIETAHLRLIKNMADRLAHEIGNAMVPLSTHQQLLAERFRDAEFRVSLDAAMAEGVKRVTRLVNQMRYLARDGVLIKDSIPLVQLIEEAFQEAHKYQPVKSARLKYEEDKRPIILTGDRAALKHAFSEVMLNALQANTSDAAIGVTMQTESPEMGRGWVQVEVKDNGTGFTPETAAKVPAPFESSRAVGLGLGLCVCRRIVEMHHGKVEFIPVKTESSGIVRITLPVDMPENRT
jgi:nitrogen-specific signal transduction histidine kinase/CheY-like chemotaxis protein